MKYSYLFILGILLIACTNSTPRRPINRTVNQKKDYSVALNKAINKIQEQQIQKYIKNDSLLNYKNSSYGFVYAFISPFNKKGKTVKEGTAVTYLKTVYNLKDDLIYSEQKVNAIVGKSNHITGIDEGLKLMREDEEIKFIFTSFVSHGFYGDKNKIGRNTPIIVNIKLLKIDN